MSSSSFGSSKSSSEISCLDLGCYAQVVYGVDYAECFGAISGELWMVMTAQLFEAPPNGLNECYGGPSNCDCPMQLGCYKIEDPENWTLGELHYMQCMEL